MMNREEMLVRLKKDEDPLELSIEKWQDIANGKNMNEFGEINCALCEIHIEQAACEDCPIRTKTGKEGCIDTPYEDYSNAYRNNANKEALIKIALKEVEFLKSLRKEAQ